MTWPADPATFSVVVAQAAEIRSLALALGFDRVGFARVGELSAHRRFADWLGRGCAGEMLYLGGQAELRRSPALLLDGAATAIMVAVRYPFSACQLTVAGLAPSNAQPLPLVAGRVARYACGPDHHSMLRHRLGQLAAALDGLAGRRLRRHICVDSAPLLERELAASCGLGFIGRSTMLVVPGLGSHTALGCLLTDLELPPDPPARPRCGRCLLCLAACPTGALSVPATGGGEVDARRCISYLTVELRGPIPRPLRPVLSDWLVGCDLCQDACPYNRTAAARDRDTAAGDGASLARLEAGPDVLPWALDATRVLLGSNRQHQRLVRGRAIARISRSRLARNAAVVLGNSGHPSAVPSLAGALCQHPSALVRGHAAWALGRLGGGVARQALEQARAREADRFVADEIAQALAGVP